MPRIPPDFLSGTVDHYLHVVDRTRVARVCLRVAAVVKRYNDRDFDAPRRVAREAVTLQGSEEYTVGVVMLAQHLFLPSPTSRPCSVPPASRDIAFIDTITLAACLERCKIPMRLRVQEAISWETSHWLAALDSRTKPTLWSSISAESSRVRRFCARHVACDAVERDAPLDDDARIGMTIVEDGFLKEYFSACRRPGKHVHWSGMHATIEHPTPPDPYAVKVIERLKWAQC